MVTVTTIATQDSARTEASNVSMEIRTPSSMQASSFQASSFRDVTAAVYKADVLVELKANIAQLEDLHGRLQFMMGELSYLLRKS